MSSSIIVIGAKGKMGTVTCETIESGSEFKLIGKLDKQDSLKTVITQLKPDIVIDFTNAESVYTNSMLLLEMGIKTVVGASGLNSDQVDKLKGIAQAHNAGCIIAPNFSIGAILMMRFASLAAKHLPNAEIVETHHQQKLDAPSGTAVKTAYLIEKARRTSATTNPEEKVLFDGARGAEVAGTQIHSLRLPGYIASQEVRFGGPGENLTIQHHSISRDCFMPGVLMACREVMKIDHLVYGLEHFID